MDSLKSRSRDHVYLENMLEYTAKTIKRLKSVSRDEFLHDEDLREVTAYRIAIIGEAAGRVSSEFKQENPAIDYTIIKDMRNYLIHDYVKTDYSEVWNTAKTDLPELAVALPALIALAKESAAPHS